MNIWHKRFLIIEIVLLFIMAAAGLAFNAYPWWAFAVFMLCEFVALEAQRREDPAKVYYRKSCLFATVDMLSVFWFLAVIILISVGAFTGSRVPGTRFLPVLFTYIAVRKFYILKNYSYIK